MYYNKWLQEEGGEEVEIIEEILQMQYNKLQGTLYLEVLEVVVHSLVVVEVMVGEQVETDVQVLKVLLEMVVGLIMIQQEIVM